MVCPVTETMYYKKSATGAEKQENPSKVLTFVVYAQKDCSYELYTDDGDGYAYENGAYTLETYMWNQSEQILRDSKGREVVFVYGKASK